MGPVKFLVAGCPLCLLPPCLVGILCQGLSPVTGKLLLAQVVRKHLNEDEVICLGAHRESVEELGVVPRSLGASPRQEIVLE